ncbi:MULTISPECIES: DUF4126 family protein [Agrobacterium]|uniref:DUF4126 family protein n=1 Tax=Agrobacterium tumefaciens TaxID=358 RepID=A0AAE6BFA4_AGRTU|nr:MULTISPECIES: DUF4126 family protein [Agrobacterium]QCL75868.1 DUF4126 family protein [Agrobacterium tumefaciens]QCL81427.1 DUF4126 family protein [Agrobacterium tumefaciens]CUX53647.1 conserved membrane hypothetical protein [Agrobacterium sp. NCPPB 925]
MLILLTILIGIVAGLRAMTAPAAVAWGAYLGWFDISQSSLSFMGSIWAVAIFTVLAIVELITDQLPSTPSRKVPMQFGARIATGALSGAAIAATEGMVVVGLLAGVIGAVIGTFGGAAGRAHLANRFGRDLPAALIEDAIAIALALLIATTVS